MSTIFVDVDDTVANLLPAWLGRYERDSGHRLKPEDITSWSLSDFVLPEFKQRIYEYLNDPTLYDEVYPYDDTQWGIEKLREMGHRVVFATATPNATAGRKLRWLIEHGFLKEESEYPILFHRDYVEASDKSLLRGDVLIDDGPHNIQDFKGLGILVSRPHNLSLEWPLRVTDWEGIVRLFQKWGENIPPGTHPTELKRPQQSQAFRQIVDQMYMTHLVKNKDYCLAPGTKVLTKDLRWIPIEDVREGMELIGFDEYVSQPGQHRRMYRPSVVEAAYEVTLPSYRITLENGDEFVCGANHPWLVRSGVTSGWRETKNLQAADTYSSASKLIKVLDVWESANDYDSGYLAAALDGEGWFTQSLPSGVNGHKRGRCITLGFAQKPNAMFAEVDRILTERGFPHRIRGNSHGVLQFIFGKPRKNIIRALGEVRPKRLLDKVTGQFGMVDLRDQVKVTHNEFIGDQKLIALRTSTKTYIANGYATHNSPANILGTNSIGLVTRCWDKMARIMNLTGFRVEIASSTFEPPDAPLNESLDDSWMDLSVYAIIAQIYRKGKWGR